MPEQFQKFNNFALQKPTKLQYTRRKLDSIHHQDEEDTLNMITLARMVNDVNIT